MTMQGNVKVMVQMVGAGNAPQKVNDTTKALKAAEKAGKDTGDALDEAGQSAEGLGTRVANLREQFLGLSKRADDGVLKVKEGFNKLTEAAGLIGTTVTAVGAGLAVLFDFIARDRTLERLRARFDETLESARQVTAELAKHKGVGDNTTPEYEQRQRRRAEARARAAATGDTELVARLDRDQQVDETRASSSQAYSAWRDQDLAVDRAKAARDKAQGSLADLDRAAAELMREGSTDAEDQKRLADLKAERAQAWAELNELNAAIERGEKELPWLKEQRDKRQAEASQALDQFGGVRASTTMRMVTGPDGELVAIPVEGRLEDIVVFGEEEAGKITPRGGRGGSGGRVTAEPWEGANDIPAYLLGPLGPGREAAPNESAVRDLQEEQALLPVWAQATGNNDVVAEIEANRSRQRALATELGDDDLMLQPEEIAALREELALLREEYAEFTGLLPDAEQMSADIAAAPGLEKANEELQKLLELGDRESLGGPIRDFAAALGDALPNMGAFSGALSEVSAEFDKYAKGQQSIGGAVRASVAAMARAGAEQIENEQERAAVLAAIEFGLGLASLAVFDYPGAAAHFLASTALGVAAATGSSSSASRSMTPTRDVMQTTSTAYGSGAAPTININGIWIGNGTPQESADALWTRMQAAQGTGFGFQEAS